LLDDTLLMKPRYGNDAAGSALPFASTVHQEALHVPIS
jgi:sulfur relay (sulfurtransferase) complex TusBCD TusD component (DsrE family)